MLDGLTIRELRDMAALSATIDLQKAVWRMTDVEVASPHTLKAIAHTGGCVLGAEVAGRLVGFCTGFAARRGDSLFLWSHMAAVLPEFQARGIGWRLKRAQRDWALERGYRVIAWTFDPLQSGNANFNFNRLGVTARRYEVNHYGAMQDGINAGLASDRLEAHWQLDAPPPALPSGDLPMLLRCDERGNLRGEMPTTLDAPAWGVEIPLDINALKRDDLPRAQQWQLSLRATMLALLAAGYVVAGFSGLADGLGTLLKDPPRSPHSHGGCGRAIWSPLFYSPKKGVSCRGEALPRPIARRSPARTNQRTWIPPMVDFAQIMCAGEPMARPYGSRNVAGLRANPFAWATILSCGGLPISRGGEGVTPPIPALPQSCAPHRRPSAPA